MSPKQLPYRRTDTKLLPALGAMVLLALTAGSRHTEAGQNYDPYPECSQPDPPCYCPSNTTTCTQGSSPDSCIDTYCPCDSSCGPGACAGAEICLDPPVRRVCKQDVNPEIPPPPEFWSDAKKAQWPSEFWAHYWPDIAIESRFEPPLYEYDLCQTGSCPAFYAWDPFWNEYWSGSVDLTQTGEYHLRATWKNDAIPPDSPFAADPDTSAEATIIVMDTDLTFEGLADPNEDQLPGGLLCAHGELKTLSLAGTWEPVNPPTANWSLGWGGTGNIRVWIDQGKTQEVVNGLPYPWIGRPSTVYAEGDTPGYISVTLNYSEIPPGAPSCSDRVLIIVIKPWISNGLPEDKKNLSPGLLFWPNGDDDDYDDIPDVNDSQMHAIPPGTSIPDDDDLVPIDLSIAPEPEYIPGIVEITSSGPLRLYLDRKKQTLCSCSFSPAQLPPRIWAEGLDSGEAIVSIKSNGCEDTIRFTVVVVSTVEFKTYADNWALDGCPNNGGKRVFPDMLSWADPNYGRRPWVEVTLTVSPAIKDVRVCLIPWDVDDPFDQNNPGLMRIADVDGDTIGGDNVSSPQAGDLYVPTPITDATGKLTAYFKVGMRPGDNYRLFATTIPSPTNLPKQADADATPLPHMLGGAWTEMLTVWRHLWLELDSMRSGGRLCFPEPEAIYSVTPNSPHWTDVSVDIAGAGETDGLFEGGSCNVLGTLIDNGSDIFVTLTDVPVTAVGTYVDCCDDDVPHAPGVVDTSLMQDKFRSAYVLPLTESLASNLSLPIIENATEEDFELLYGDDYRFLGTGTFNWAMQVVSAHQPIAEADGDPDTVYHFHNVYNFKHGDGSLIFGETPQGAPGTWNPNISLIYKETIRDEVAQCAEYSTIGTSIFCGLDPPGLTAQQIESYVVVHEVGHAFGCTHNDGAGSVMAPGSWDPAAPFSGTSLAHIRWDPWIEIP